MRDKKIVFTSEKEELVERLLDLLNEDYNLDEELTHFREENDLSDMYRYFAIAIHREF